MTCCQNMHHDSPTTTASVTRRERQVFKPVVDILETADHWVILADVPGAHREQIDMTVEDDVLTLRAPVNPRHVDADSYIVREYPVGDYERSFRLGEGIDAARISATLEAGVLTIELPKSESSKPRKVQITTK